MPAADSKWKSNLGLMGLSAFTDIATHVPLARGERGLPINTAVVYVPRASRHLRDIAGEAFEVTSRDRGNLERWQ